MKLEGKGSGLFNAGGGTIELTETGVAIFKKNANLSSGGAIENLISVATASKGGLTIPYSSISHISISKGSWAAQPFLQVLSPGDRPVGEITEAIGTPNCLLFKKDMMSKFEELKAEVEKRSALAKNTQSFAQSSPADEIKKLGELKSAGLLTEEEFNAKKKQILGL